MIKALKIFNRHRMLMYQIIGAYTLLYMGVTEKRETLLRLTPCTICFYLSKGFCPCRYPVF